MTAFDLDAMCRDIMAMNEANAAMYRRMRGSMRPVSEAGYTPGDDMGDLVNANLRQMAGPINQTNEE